MNLLASILDALIPPHDDARIAERLTRSDLAAFTAPRTVRGAFTVFPYHHRKIRAMVRAIKYYGTTSVLEPLGAVMAERVVGRSPAPGSILVPVPASPARLRKRGYNQAERIARAVHDHLPKELGIIYGPRLLAREDRETQVHARRTRAENIRGAFYVPKNTIIYDSVRDSRIILIDDVVKTGATIRDATRALKAAGAVSVTAVAVAY